MTKRGTSKALGGFNQYRPRSPGRGDGDSVDMAIGSKNKKDKHFKFGKVDEQAFSKLSGHYMPLLMK